MKKKVSSLLAVFALLLIAQVIQAGSATWNLNATSGDWNTAANWTPATVPNGRSDVASFDASDITAISISGGIKLDRIVFDPGASAFNVTAQSGIYQIMGVGIVNNSGVMQNIGSGDGAVIEIGSDATAGSGVQYTLHTPSSSGGGAIILSKNASGGSASFVGDGASDSIHNGAILNFVGTSTAAQATIVNNASPTNGPFVSEGATCQFGDSATAGDATITNKGGATSAQLGGRTVFYQSSSAENATIIAEGGTDNGFGGTIDFQTDAQGGTARIELFGNSVMDIHLHNRSPSLTIGSLEGNGLVSLGTNNLTIGSNNLSTTFSGVIQDDGLSGGRGGSLTKIGRGNLTLTNASSYTGGTIISDGILLANNTTGSATGIGRVRVMAGTLGGSGIIGGGVVVGTGSGSGAILGPGNGSIPGTLTIQKKLTLKRDATYRVLIDSSTSAADQVSAIGITIRNALIQFQDHGAAVLPPGTTFTVIENSAATSIAGTFSNLPDGSTLIVGNNNFQVDYEGGDGNDLTLTVVP
jgi:autotransporter-associated beta strand protein